MVLAFREEQHQGFVQRDAGDRAFDTCNQLLADQVCHQVFLGRIDPLRQPEYPHLLQERENDLGDRFFDAPGTYLLVDEGFKTIHIHIDHPGNHIVYDALQLRLGIVEGQDTGVDLLLVHPVDMGDFEPVFIKQRNIEDGLQLLIRIIPDIGTGALGPEKGIPLFPDADCVGLDPGKLF